MKKTVIRFYRFRYLYYFLSGKQ